MPRRSKMAIEQDAIRKLQIIVEKYRPGYTIAITYYPPTNYIDNKQEVKDICKKCSKGHVVKMGAYYRCEKCFELGDQPEEA